MNLINRGNWNIVKGKLKEKYGDLSDKDFAEAEGEQDQIVGIIQKKLGKGKEEIMNDLKEFISV